MSWVTIYGYYGGGYGGNTNYAAGNDHFQSFFNQFVNDVNMRIDQAMSNTNGYGYGTTIGTTSPKTEDDLRREANKAYEDYWNPLGVAYGNTVDPTTPIAKYLWIEGYVNAHRDEIGK